MRSRRSAPTATLVARTARDGVRAIAELPALLPEHDVVAIAVPHTDETRGLVDAAFLAALPDGALLVNVARGAIVDTDALLAELTRRPAARVPRRHRPRAAAAPSIRCGSAPNLLLTPHVGGGTRGWQRRAYGWSATSSLRYVRGRGAAERGRRAGY